MIDRSVAVIGSFRRYNRQVQDVCADLRAAGIVVTSPRGEEILKEGIEFVRFASDDADWSDPAIQTLALHRIFRADLVYVVSPDGYVGRTTCYEVGRVIQQRKPIYFSARPRDLPLHLPDSCVLDVNALIQYLLNTAWQPVWPFEGGLGKVESLERELLEGKFRND